MLFLRSGGGRLSHRIAQDKAKDIWTYIVTGLIIVAAVIGLFFVKAVIDNLALEERAVLPGATFSKKYAAELGLDWRETYLAALDDLGVRAFRIPVYWDDIEPEPGQFDFADVDWQLREAGRRGAKVILAVGMKTPRWPECHFPKWTGNLGDDAAIQARTEVMLQAVVQHFSTSSDFIAWQVENEPLFQFGDCPEPDWQFLRHEIDIIKSMDSRPVILTESGELSDWIRAASITDVLGISTYRAVWNRYVGFVFWPTTPKWYSLRIKAVRPLVDAVFVSELQAEPWSPGPIRDWDINEQLQHMNPERLESNMAFVRRMGVNEAYLWGIEWWYWLKTQGHPEMWEAGKGIFGGPTEAESQR